MSDNVAIKEGARAYNFTTDKIRTAQQNSDEPVIWVPESTVKLGSLRASENGVYLARSGDLYGFNEIVVSVNGAATIGDRAVFPDDSGELHEENLPHDIVIFRPPKKLVYSDGEKINLGGIVVMAMDADGNVWTNARYPDGHIPLGELVCSPPTATTGAYLPTNVSYGDVLCSIPYIDHGYNRVYTYTGTGRAYYAGVQFSPDHHGPLIIGLSRSDCAYLVTPEPGQTAGFGSVEYDGSTFCFNAEYWLPPGGGTVDVVSILQSIGARGDHGSTVTVSWARYGDGAILSTSFDISV